MRLSRTNDNTYSATCHYCGSTASVPIPPGGAKEGRMDMADVHRWRIRGQKWFCATCSDEYDYLCMLYDRSMRGWPKHKKDTEAKRYEFADQALTLLIQHRPLEYH